MRCQRVRHCLEVRSFLIAGRQEEKPFAVGVGIRFPTVTLQALDTFG